MSVHPTYFDLATPLVVAVVDADSAAERADHAADRQAVVRRPRLTHRGAAGDWRGGAKSAVYDCIIVGADADSAAERADHAADWQAVVRRSSEDYDHLHDRGPQPRRRWKTHRSEGL